MKNRGHARIVAAAFATLIALAAVPGNSAELAAKADDYRGELNQPPGGRLNSDFERKSQFLQLGAQDTFLGRTSLFLNLADVDQFWITRTLSLAVSNLGDTDYLQRLGDPRQGSILVGLNFGY